MSATSTSTGRGQWAQPGVEQVAPGVHRVPLPLPSDALRAVNVYVLDTPDGPVLVDGGWHVAEGRAALDDGLAALGWTVRDIRRFLVTHVHRDHYTLAVAVRREVGDGGPTVGLGAGEQPTLAWARQPQRGPDTSQARQLQRCGADELVARLRAAVGSVPPADPADWADPDVWLAEGPLDLPGGRTLEAVATPGHTSGHLVFHDLAAGLLFAGDHVLPTITPSIGFEPVLSPDPLGAFLRSLARVRARPDARLLPAHGPVTDSVHARIDELLDHHGRRLDEAHRLAEGRDVTAAEVAGQLRWTRRERRLDELDPFNQMLAVLETCWHLDLLVAQGRLAASPDPVVRYR